MILKVHTVEVQNTTKEHKFAENYHREIEFVYAKLTNEWKVDVVGLVTDASGEARKALFVCLSQSTLSIPTRPRTISMR